MKTGLHHECNINNPIITRIYWNILSSLEVAYLHKKLCIRIYCLEKKISNDYFHDH